MSDTAENLKAFIGSDSSVKEIVSSRIYEDKVPQSDKANPPPYIWFATRQEVPSTVINGSVGELPDSILFDLECVAMVRNTSKNLARLVRAMLNNYSSQTTGFNGTSVKGIFVRDKDSDYAPVNGDRGQYVTAFDVEVWL